MQTVVRVKNPGVSGGAQCCEAYLQEVDQVPNHGDKEGKPLGFQQREGKGTTVLNKEPQPQQGLSSGETHPPELSPAGLISASLAWGKTVTIHSPSSHPIPPKKGGAPATLVKLTARRHQLSKAEPLSQG